MDDGSGGVGMGSGDELTDAEIDAVVDSFLAGNATTQNICWEPVHPRGGKFFDSGYTGSEISGATPLAVFTPNASKAHGWAISEPANATARAVEQTARLKAKYE